MATIRPSAGRMLQLSRRLVSSNVARSVSGAAPLHTTPPAEAVVNQDILHSRFDPRRAPHSATESDLSSSAGLSRFPQASTREAVPTDLRETLPLLAAQRPHYITIHIHGKPYLVTAGDTVRLPFLMHGVEPGDVLRLNRASVLGSRDFTLRAGSVVPQAHFTTSAASASDRIVGNVEGLDEKTLESPRIAVANGHEARRAAATKEQYIDETLYTCRATVMGVESEPMRFTEKTKQRQRHVRVIRSRHRHTILRISELTVNLPETL